MFSIKSLLKPKIILVAITSMLVLSACSKDDNPVESGGSTSKVSGRISTSSASQNVLAKTSGVESVDGATVILAQVQADGSLKTVSTQSVQTDVNGKFVVETKLSDVKNLVVVAEKASAKWKAVVSAQVKSGTTVYAPPLNSESTTEADLYIKLVSSGQADANSESDLKLFINSESAAEINGNSDAETKFINAFSAHAQATAQAAGNSYFGLTNAQVQAFLKAKADASAKLDQDLYMSGDSDSDVEAAYNNYENTVLTANSTNNINANVYAELMRIGLSAYTNASASMQSQARFATSKSFYLRYALVLNYAMKQQFQAAGASSDQVNSVNSAGVSLYSSIKSSANLDDVNNAFIQYQSSIKSQLKVTLNSYASFIDTIDSNVNSTGGAKTVLTSSINVGVSFSAVINAYIAFYNSIKTLAQATITGASSTQVNAASQILIMANMN